MSLRTTLAAVCLAGLSACSFHSLGNLKPGTSSVSDVLATFGPPAMRWVNTDGSMQLAYPGGPAGFTTHMVFVAPDGVIERVEQVLDQAHFSQIESGKSSQEDVLRLLGPSFPAWTVYFEARDELVWEWRYCDAWWKAAKFDVLFDGTTGLVRSTYSLPDLDGRRIVPSCSP
ncbi:hypothetical protein [uncultured Propionivibrio sp.]|uniref:hypothetical protein n=1 Tax=uncultured Propionivibrio sp. TaxID=426737 RepID=UPI0029C0B27F|nr:hypothetical protein [uncultured Propionivibrio sp.]